MVHLAPPHNGAAITVADEDVFRHVQVGKDHWLLIDRSDAVILRLSRIADLNKLVIQQHLTLIGFVNPRHDLDQGGFSRAILPDQGVNLSWIDFQRHIIQCLGGVKALGNVPDFHDWLLLNCCCHNSPAHVVN